MRDCKFKKGSEGSEKSLKNFPYPYKTSNAGGLAEGARGYPVGGVFLAPFGGCQFYAAQVLSSGFHLFLFLLFGLGPVAIAFGLVSFADLLLLDFISVFWYTSY